MNEIKCPECGKVFKVDESGFAGIVKQVRDHEFAEELRRREASFAKEKQKGATCSVYCDYCRVKRGEDTVYGDCEFGFAYIEVHCQRTCEVAVCNRCNRDTAACRDINVSAV